jgi:hypothetical protein
MIDPEQITDPERKLWAYVLLQAHTDLGGRDPLARSARLWFTSKDDAIGSFTWICHHLSLEPDAVRQRVLRQAAQKMRDSISNLAQTTNRAA